jgi:hypothetical protein
MNLQKNKLLYLTTILISIFALRLTYSLTTEFWYPDEDVLQIYLIGLKYFTTGIFPYFGADLVYTKAQIPGALQAFLVSAGWFIKEIPESPFVVLNILLTSSLAFLAWYITKRVASVKPFIIWIWVFITPWSLCYFSRIINPSYVVPGAILFFIGIFEIYPMLIIKIIPEKLSFYMIGFALLWIFQLHMSWVLLIPFILLAFYFLIKNNNFKIILNRIIYFMLGCLTTGVFVIPTFLKYGLSNQNGISSTSVIQFNVEHFKEVFNYLVKYLAYSCFDTTRFFGADAAQRYNFLRDYLWASPFTVIVTIFGIIQLLFLIIFLFKKENPSKQWKAIKNITLLGFLLMYSSSWFSVASPGGHSTVLYFPLVMIYTAHCFEKILQKKWMINTMIIVFISAFIMSSAIAYKNYNTISIYKKRDAVEKALKEKDYHFVGKRRYEDF